MTLSQSVADAVNELDAAHDQRFAPWRNQWQTIRAHLLSQDAEIEHKEQEWNEMFDRALVAESRIAAADALLRKVATPYYDSAERLQLFADIQTHLQGSGDEAGS